MEDENVAEIIICYLYMLYGWHFIIFSDSHDLFAFPHGIRITNRQDEFMLPMGHWIKSWGLSVWVYANVYENWTSDHKTIMIHVSFNCLMYSCRICVSIAFHGNKINDFIATSLMNRIFYSVDLGSFAIVIKMTMQSSNLGGVENVNQNRYGDKNT